jgi:hypothetical protein
VESSAEKRVKAMFYSKQKISAELPEAEWKNFVPFKFRLPI